MQNPLLAIACSLLLIHAGCVTPTWKKTTHAQPGQRALVVFKITHQDRAGESGTLIRKTGEIVTVGRDGWAIIATPEGDILRCPAKALHAVTPQLAAALPARQPPAPDYVAGEELERWFPADGVPFTLRWMSPEEIAQVLRQSKP